MIEIRDVTVAYGGVPVLERCSLTVKPGARAALMGPSGCGKTTLLRCVAGLVKPDAGTVTVKGRPAVIFQEPRLFPWLTAEQNIDLVLPGASGGSRQWLKRVGLEDAAEKYPSELSGGMRQRLNLCRALAWGGDVLLVDEPFQGLDASLRAELLALLERESAGKTLLFVTHDPEDLVLADAVYRYRDRSFFPNT